MDRFYKLATENDFFSVYLTHVNYHLFFLQVVERQQAQDAPVRNIFKSLLLGVFVSKRRISSLINSYDSPNRI